MVFHKIDKEIYWKYAIPTANIQNINTTLFMQYWLHKIITALHFVKLLGIEFLKYEEVNWGNPMNIFQTHQ